MSIFRIIGPSAVALAIAITPLPSVTFGISGVAFAKDGNGNSGGGHGNGNGGNHGGANSGQGKSHNTRSGRSSTEDSPTLGSLFTHGKKADKATRTDKATGTHVKSLTSGLSSLNRNYHAYMHSNDPRMAAISAYVMAYAEFEAENGPDAIPADPALSDDALRDALESFTKGGVVTDATLDKAKDILGVGPAVGKIDQIRDTLPETTAPETTSETTTTVTVTTETTTPETGTAN